MTDMKLGLSLGYWGSNPPTQHIQMAQQAEQLGYDSVWTAKRTQRRPYSLSLDRRTNKPHSPGYRYLSDIRSHTHSHGHGSSDHGPPVEWPNDIRLRSVRPPGC